MKTSSRSPNGTAASKPKTSRPIGDHRTIGIENATATRKRLRMSLAMSAIDISSCPSWPAVLAGGLRRAGLQHRIAEVLGTDWPAQ